MKLNRATKVELVGRGTITLSPSDHLATGGEGSIYRQGNLVIKLYTDPAKMRREQMADKIHLLSTLKHPYLSTPSGVVTNAAGDPIGLYLPYADGEPLSRVFTTDFRTRTGFGDREANTLAARMLEVVDFAHANKAILVDPNELNWLAHTGGAKGPEPTILDVDSWAIDRWNARSIMPSIRDWHTQGFNEATDRFAWGVVSFQLYTGIHPYKGTLAGYKPSELERRMKENASVFAPGVRLNRAVRDFACIPGPLLGWYEATFQKGARCAPPSPLAPARAPASPTIKVARMVVSGQGSLRYDRLYDAGLDPAIRIFPCGVVLQRSGRLYDLGRNRPIGLATASDVEVIKAESDWVVARLGAGGLEAVLINGTNFTSTPLPLNLSGRALVRQGNRLFLVTENGLTELRLMRFTEPILVADQTWGALPNATRWFDGVGVQDTFGAVYLIAPFGDKACAQVRARELDGLRVITATAGPRFVAVICADHQGNYRTFEFSFDRTYGSYRLWEGHADAPELNLSILPRGVVATVVKDGELVIFVPASGSVNRVADRDVTTEMRLANWDDRVVYIRDGQVWAVRTGP